MGPIFHPPFTRNIIINRFFKKQNIDKNPQSEHTLDGEIIEDKNKKDEL